MNTMKRKRAVNFVLKESRILVDLALKYQHIIENKQSDCVSWANKKEAWAAIEKEFNVSSGQSFRTAEALHAKYETIKKDIRKKAAAIRKSIFLTGGGQENTPEYLDFEEKLFGVIYVSVEGLPSIGDSDEVILKVSNKKVETQACEDNICQDVDTMLIEPTSHELDTQPTTISKPESTAGQSKDIEIENQYTDEINTQPSPREKRKWTPNFLKSSKSAALLVKKKDPTVMQDKFSKLVQAKKELMHIQKQLQTTESTYTEKEHIIKEKIFQQELENLVQRNTFDKIIHEKQLELLNMKISCKKLEMQMLETELEK